MLSIRTNLSYIILKVNTSPIVFKEITVIYIITIRKVHA
jgi:hypothetical protein